MAKVIDLLGIKWPPELVIWFKISSPMRTQVKLNNNLVKSFSEKSSTLEI
jgi:hypothetical protein